MKNIPSKIEKKMALILSGRVGQILPLSSVFLD